MHPDYLPAEFPGLGAAPGLCAGTSLRSSSPTAVARRLGLDAALLPRYFLRQVHGTQVWQQQRAASHDLPQADAVWTRERRLPCIVRTADCLPVLLVDAARTCVAAIHAGWRGLCGGIIEATVTALPVAPASLHAWLGPAIGPERFEVGPEVRAAFVDRAAGAAAAFRRGRDDRWWADLPALARQRLMALGVVARHIAGGHWCTASDPERWFSYRRDPGDPGRLLSFIQLT